MNPMENSSKDVTVTIMRHGESLHNIDRNYSLPDPPLTETGRSHASQVKVEGTPDIVIISPLTRTLQSAVLVFGSLITGSNATIEVQVWPEIREAHNEIINTGASRADLTAKFPDFDFSNCHEQWEYESHTTEGAVTRAERVRRKLRALGKTHKRIVLVTHRGIIAFLVYGPRFKTCETRSYRFADDHEVEGNRFAENVDIFEQQDFGPTLLLPQVKKLEGICDHK